jgi:hypothetical protein
MRKNMKDLTKAGFEDGRWTELGQDVMIMKNGDIFC